MLPNPVDAGRTDEWQRMLDTDVAGVLGIVRAFTADLVVAAAEGRTADLSPPSRTPCAGDGAGTTASSGPRARR